jgi:DNA-binding HxlR family transcriptional regulator
MATTTAAQRRAAARVQFDAFMAACPSRKLLDRVSDKWVVLIMCALGGDDPRGSAADNGGGPRPLRYAQLARTLAGVSQKMRPRRCDRWSATAWSRAP